MKKYEKEVEKSLLQSEIEARDAIKRDYAAALKRVQERIAKLTEEYQEHPELASKIYQRKYQENLERELKKALSGLSDQSYDKTMDYLQYSYQDAYIGANYCLNMQGYNLFLMYDQKKMMDAIYDTAKGFKLSAAAYGENVDKLRRKLQQELSRGLNSGMDYSTISKLASQKVQMSFNHTKRIIATEGHRVQNISKFQAAFEARAQGADQVKMWSSTLDEKTRERHQMLHGQIRELEDPFTALGAEAQYPGGFGIAGEDIECRCVLCLRARKVLSRKEKNQLRSYAEFKEKYRNTVNDLIEKSGDGKLRTQEELQAVAEDIHSQIGKYSKRPSKWSGKLHTDISLMSTDVAGIKEWNCDITVCPNISDSVLWHELLHSCSASYYSSEGYISNRFIEEASVQFLTKQIAIELGVEYQPAYLAYVDALEHTNDALKLFSTNMEFAEELFNVPMTERYDWLVQRVLEADTLTVEQAQEYIDYLEEVALNG